MSVPDRICLKHLIFHIAAMTMMEISFLFCLQGRQQRSCAIYPRGDVAGLFSMT